MRLFPISARVERARANEHRDQLASARVENARLSRELAQAEARNRELSGRPQPVMPQRLIVEWEDGYRDQIDVRSYMRPFPR